MKSILYVKLTSKIAILTTALLVVLSCNLMAQGIEQLKKYSAKERALILTDTMRFYLKPDFSQTKKIYETNLKYAYKVDTILKSQDSKYTKYTQAKALDQQKDSELQRILSFEQFRVYLEIKKKMVEQYKKK